MPWCLHVLKRTERHSLTRRKGIVTGLIVENFRSARRCGLPRYATAIKFGRSTASVQPSGFQVVVICASVASNLSAVPIVHQMSAAGLEVVHVKI